MRQDLLHGVWGGLIGGAVFAGIMFVNGTLLTTHGMITLPLIGSLVGHPSAWIGLMVHMLNSAIIGAGYAITLGRFEKGMVDGLHLGMIYGAIWWWLGPLTLMPMLLGEPIASRWTFDSALSMFPSLIGHVVFGIITALTVGMFRDASLPVPEPVHEAGAAPVSAEEETFTDRSIFTEPPPPPSARPKGSGVPRRVPLWMSMSLILILFTLNVFIFAYAAASGGFPHAHEATAPAAPAPAPDATAEPGH